jgi:hypothetical protein
MDAVQDGNHTSLRLWRDPHDRLRIRVENRDTCILVRVEGEIDYLTADAFREHVLSHASAAWRIILDLQDVAFCDSSGLGALVDSGRPSPPGGAGWSSAARAGRAPHGR